MRFNLISRVADDKNFFVDLIYAVYQAKVLYNIDAELMIVGSISNNSIYTTLLRLIELLGLSRNVKFTAKSIRLADMDEEMKSGYFLNYSVGRFVGYSSIESIKAGFKTLFYNVDAKYINDVSSYGLSYISDHTSFTETIKHIYFDKQSFDEKLQLENTQLMKSFSLNEPDKTKLIKMMSLP